MPLKSMQGIPYQVFKKTHTQTHSILTKFPIHTHLRMNCFLTFHLENNLIAVIFMQWCLLLSLSNVNETSSHHYTNMYFPALKRGYFYDDLVAFKIPIISSLSLKGSVCTGPRINAYAQLFIHLDTVTQPKYRITPKQLEVRTLPVSKIRWSAYQLIFALLLLTVEAACTPVIVAEQNIFWKQYITEKSTLKIKEETENVYRGDIENIQYIQMVLHGILKGQRK